MSVTVQSVLQVLQQYAPVELACDWDNVGLLVDAGRPVSRIATALDITPAVVAEAAQNGCELIVAHHPVIFHPFKRIEAGDVPALLLQNGISAICMHTNLDAAPGGVNDTLAGLLGMTETEVFAEGCGRIGRLETPTTAEALARRCADLLGSHPQYVEADRPVARLAESAGQGAVILKKPSPLGQTAWSPARPPTTSRLRRAGSASGLSSPATGPPSTRSPPCWPTNSPPPCPASRRWPARPISIRLRIYNLARRAALPIPFFEKEAADGS